MNAPWAFVTAARAAELVSSSKLDRRSSGGKSGGAYRDRTDDLMLAKQPLSQLS